MVRRWGGGGRDARPFSFGVAVLRESYRPHSEDRAEVIEREDGLVIAVADGVGGRPGGGEAADLVVRLAQERAPGIRNLNDPRAWQRLLQEIDGALDEDTQAGETTAVLLAVTPRGIAGASVGDSEAWLITSTGYTDLTGRQGRKPFLGVGMAFPALFSAPFPAGTLLVATDGLFKYTSPERICEAALDPDLDRAAARLLELVRLRSGALPDDVAMVLGRLAA